METQVSSYITGGNEKWYMQDTQGKTSKRGELSNNKTTFDPTVPLLELFSEYTYPTIQKYSVYEVLLVALFVSTNTEIYIHNQDSLNKPWYGKKECNQKKK